MKVAAVARNKVIQVPCSEAEHAAILSHCRDTGRGLSLASWARTRLLPDASAGKKEKPVFNIIRALDAAGLGGLLDYEDSTVKEALKDDS